MGVRSTLPGPIGPPRASAAKSRPTHSRNFILQPLGRPTSEATRILALPGSCPKYRNQHLREGRITASASIGPLSHSTSSGTYQPRLPCPVQSFLRFWTEKRQRTLGQGGARAWSTVAMLNAKRSKNMDTEEFSLNETAEQVSDILAQHEAELADPDQFGDELEGF